MSLDKQFRAQVAASLIGTFVVGTVVGVHTGNVSTTALAVLFNLALSGILLGIETTYPVSARRLPPRKGAP